MSRATELLLRQALGGMVRTKILSTVALPSFLAGPVTGLATLGVGWLASRLSRTSLAKKLEPLVKHKKTKHTNKDLDDALAIIQRYKRLPKKDRTRAEKKRMRDAVRNFIKL